MLLENRLFHDTVFSLGSTVALLMFFGPLYSINSAADQPAGFLMTPGQRKEIDQAAIDLPADKLKPRREQFYSDLTGWLVSRSPLPRDEEERRTAASHQALVDCAAKVDPPVSVYQALEKLTDALPLHMQPLIDDYSVTVFETDEFISESVGEPFIHLAAKFVRACDSDAAGQDRLAFAIAHELGHICRKHCRSRHQLLWFKDLADNGSRIGLSSERIAKAIAERTRNTGKRIQFVATLEEDFDADLFAIHLCRNAGFDIENGIDVVRKVAAETDAETTRNRMLQRLRAMRNDLDGRVDHPEYGLFRVDVQTGKLTRIADQELATVNSATVCLHGMESNLATLKPMFQALGNSIPGKPVFGLQYPSDASLSRIGEFFHKELARTGANTADYDFIAHSAGGLVIRYLLELKRRPVRRAVFVATPHFGSDLSKLRPLLEAKQFFSSLRLGYGDAVEKVIADGRGQITWDLQPDSLFLQFLNRATNPREVDRYHVINGRAMSALKGMLLKTAVAAVRETIERTAFRSANAPGPLRRGVREWVSELDIPAEIVRGDLAVSLDRSTLEDVASETTFEHTHTKLPDEPDVLSHIIDILNWSQ